MSEKDTMLKSASPCTRDSLAEELRALGVKAGMTLIVHSSLSSLGWVCGGAETVIHALMDVLTEEGTLVMPTQTTGNSNPENWQNPPVPAEWIEIIKATMPAYDPARTPTREMGAVPELFRTWPDVIRSLNPKVSFAAWGKHKDLIIEGHSIDYGFGEQSPLARMYDLGGHILLLGVDYDSCTALHLAEYRAPGQVLEPFECAVFENGNRVWRKFEDIEIDADVFPAIGSDLEREVPIRISQVGLATAKLLPTVETVDFGVKWLTSNRHN